MNELYDRKPLSTCPHSYPDIIHVMDASRIGGSTPLTRAYYCTYCGLLEAPLLPEYLGNIYLKRLADEYRDVEVNNRNYSQTQLAARLSFDHANQTNLLVEGFHIGQRVKCKEDIPESEDHPATPAGSTGRILDIILDAVPNAVNKALFLCRFSNGNDWRWVELKASEILPLEYTAADPMLFLPFARCVDKTYAKPSLMQTLYWFDSPLGINELVETYMDRYPTYNDGDHVARPVYTIPLPKAPEKGRSLHYLPKSILMHLGDPMAGFSHNIEHESFRIAAFSLILNANVIFIYQTNNITTPRQFRWLSSLIHECLSVKPVILFCSHPWLEKARRYFGFPNPVTNLLDITP